MPQNDVDLLYAIDLTPEQAVKYFQSKGYTFSWDWHDTWQEAHSKAFTVAKAMRMDVLEDIRDMVDKAIGEGITFGQFKKELIPKLQAKGWWGKVLVGDEEGAKLVQLGSVRRLQTIYQTNLQTAYMSGRYAEFIENTEDRPYWQYVAVMDSRTRPAHAALHGKVFRYDDPFWESFYPPNGWNCRCRVRALSKRDMTKRGLDLSSSEGNLSAEERLVSKKTGELRDVTVYRDPRTGLEIAPDAGWSYNPGRAAWNPDLDKYPYDVAKKYIEGAITATAYTMFFEGKLKGNFPVAVLDDEIKDALDCKSRVVNLSDKTLREHVESHLDLTIEDYRKIPKIIDEGEIYQQGDRRLVYLWDDNVLYRLSLKTTEDGKENYFLSLFKTTDEKAEKQVRAKYRKIR